MARKRLSNKYSHYCKICPSYSLAQKKGIEVFLNKRKHLIGTRRLIPDGYPEVYVGANYPYYRGNGNGYWMREHVVMADHIKKPIPKGMVIHHIDGDKENNNIKNLFLCSVDEHNKCHARIEGLIFQLVRAGYVEFHRETLDYTFAKQTKELLSI